MLNITYFQKQSYILSIIYFLYFYKVQHKIEIPNYLRICVVGLLTHAHGRSYHWSIFHFISNSFTNLCIEVIILQIYSTLSYRRYLSPHQNSIPPSTMFIHDFFPNTLKPKRKELKESSETKLGRQQWCVVIRVE